MEALRSWKALSLTVCLVAFATPSFAQAVYGSLYGTVTDTTGASVPDATVTITDVAKGTSDTAQTNSSGGYSVEHLIPDIYNIKISATGFRGFETKNIQVFADTSPKVDAVLQAGGANETVEVRADAIPELKTDRADVSTIFNERSVEDLPLPGATRNFTSLQLLLPGTQLLGWSHAASENPQASQQIIVNGQHFAGTAYELDGTDNQDPILGIIVVNPNLDAVSEVKITTQNYDAEFGKAVSAVITAQTKSGGNKFHGTGFFYRKSDANLARDPFSQGKRDPVTNRFVPPALFKQFGGSIGGPIIHDKYFFFGDYQGLRQTVGTSNPGETVPSALVQSSCASGAGCNFSEYAAAAGAPVNNFIFDPVSGAPYVGSIIPNSQLSPAALAALKLVPGPTDTSKLFNNFSPSGTGSFNNNQYDIRLDGQVTDRLHAFTRFSRFTDTLSGTTEFGQAGGLGFGIGGFGGTSNGINTSVAAGVDYALNPGLLTDVRLGYFRYNIKTQKYTGSNTFASALNIPGLNIGGLTGGASGFFITDNHGNNGNGLSNVGSGLGVNRCNCPLIENEDQFQVVNNWTKIWGNHAIKIGADLRYARNLRVPSDQNRAGEFSFSQTATAGTAQTFGLGLATFVLGDVTTFNRYVSTSTNAKEFQKRTFFYIQDTYRATPKLTLNYGVRWEIYFPEKVNAKGNGSLLNLATGNLQVGGFGPFDTNSGVNTDYKAFAPRIGLAYQATPTTVVRAGYGRSFDIGVFGSIFGHTLTQNLPVLARQNLTNSGGHSFAFNLAQGPVAPVFTPIPANGLIPLPNGINARARPLTTILPTIDAWNLSVQQQLTHNLNFTLAYVANKGTHTFAGDNPDINVNQPAISRNGYTFGLPPCDPTKFDVTGPGNGTCDFQPARRRYFATRRADGSLFGWTQDISYFQNGADTHYNALQATLEKRFASGLQFTANYAWQRAFNYDPDYFTNNKRVNYGPSTDLRRNQFTLYGNYELPFGHGRQFASGVPAIVNYVIGGYQLSGNANWSSGLPYTPSYNECGADRDTGPCRPNGDAGNFSQNLGSFIPGFGRQYFTPVAPLTTNGATSGPFSRPAVATFGNVGRNSLIGPRFFNTDLSLLKNFPIREAVSLQVRVDAFNAFNHINPGQPNSCIDCSISSNAGVITSQAIGATPRQLEFAIRAQF